MIAFQNINFPQEEIEYSNKEIKLRINNSGYEPGELIITKNEIAWIKNDSDSQGFSIPWDKIVVQAISSENQRSIYFMIDCEWPATQNVVNPSNGASNGGAHHEEAANDADDDNEEFVDCDEESEITEFWMVPENAEEVDTIYLAMIRYPQRENMQESSDEEENFLDGEDIEQMNINDERFADD